MFDAVLCRLAAGRRLYRKKCTVKTVGFICDVKLVGETDGDVPQALVRVNALDENGGLFRTSLLKHIARELLLQLKPGCALPILYNPKNKAQAVFDSYPDETRIQELMDLHECGKHPEGTPMEERRRINRNGVIRRALLENIRLTARREHGEQEAEVTVRFFDDFAGTDTARRRMYLNERVLQHLAVGGYIDIRMVPENKNLFAFIVPASQICPF